MTNFVFVHGGMIGGNCWKDVRKILEDKKHTVLTPTLTGLGERKHLSHPDVDLETHIQDVVNTIFYEELEDVVLVGHSYGGMVITGALNQIPNKIKKLIYVAAVLPENGESMFDAVGPEISSFISDSVKQGNGWEVPAGSAESYGFHNLEMAKWFEKMSTPQSIKTFQQKLHLNNTSFQEVEKMYIKGSQDPVLDAMVTRAKKMHIPCYEVNSGHFPMLTAPKALVELLL